MDKKAQEILKQTFWSSAGWKSDIVISESDREYASLHGCWYPNGNVSHDKEIDRLISLVHKIDKRRLVKNFLASLSTRNLYIRSGLGSYAVHLHLENHKKTEDIHCRICGAPDLDADFDKNILNFERIKWGGVRHNQPFYAVFDLETTKDLALEPTKDDLTIFQNLISIIKKLPPEARIRDAEKAIGIVLESNKDERKQLLEILGYCGVLQPVEISSFLSDFVPVSDRSIPSVNKIDWSYPICWWRGSDGINVEALEFYFGNLIKTKFV